VVKIGLMIPVVQKLPLVPPPLARGTAAAAYAFDS